MKLIFFLALLAYWDKDDCGPDGNDKNSAWCDKKEGGKCQAVVETDECLSCEWENVEHVHGLAALKYVHGDETATSFSENYELNGCQYAYYAKYVRLGMLCQLIQVASNIFVSL